MNDSFIQWATENPVAHLQAAHAAWQAQQAKVDRLTAEVMALRQRCEHLEQKRFETKAKVYAIK